MTALYVDTSVIVRAYLSDEPEHRQLKELVRGGKHEVLTSQLSRTEFAGAIVAAYRTGRIKDATPFLRAFDNDTTQAVGRIKIIPFKAQALSVARQYLIDNYPLRTLDAIHLAVASHDAPEIVEEPVEFVTRDQRQADAAKANGLAVR